MFILFQFCVWLYCYHISTEDTGGQTLGTLLNNKQAGGFQEHNVCCNYKILGEKISTSDLWVEDGDWVLDHPSGYDGNVPFWFMHYEQLSSEFIQSHNNKENGKGDF